MTQSGWKGEGKAADMRLRNFGGRRSRDTMPVKKRCGRGSRQTALAGSREGSIIVMPFPPLTGMGGYVPGGISSLGDFLSFNSSRQSKSPSGLEILALSLMQV